MKKYIVYVVKCDKTNKMYVGATSNGFSERWKQHERQARSGAQSVLHKAIRKHGSASFELIETLTLKDRREMFDEEKRQIATRQTVAPSGYNLTNGGEGVSGSPETRRIQSEKAKIKHQDCEFKEKHRASIVSSFEGEDGMHRRKVISASKTGRKMHPNAAKAILASKKTEEYRKIAAAAASKTWATPGYREKWSKSKREKHIRKAKRFPMREDGVIFRSTRSAANYMKWQGFDKAAPNNICLACNGKYNTSYGFVWEWVDGEEARASGAEIL